MCISVIAIVTNMSISVIFIIIIIIVIIIISSSSSYNRRLVTICYGVSIVAEQEDVRQSWMARVKHPMLRLTKPNCYDLTNIAIFTQRHNK